MLCLGLASGVPMLTPTVLPQDTLTGMDVAYAAFRRRIPVLCLYQGKAPYEQARRPHAHPAPRNRTACLSCGAAPPLGAAR